VTTDTLTRESLGGLKVFKVEQRAPYINMLVYGDSGVGKTMLTGSADACPDLRPVILIDFEGGTETLRHFYPNVEQVRVTTWKEMQQVYDELHKGRHGYQTVILDSLTEIQKFNMYSVMEELLNNRPDLDPDVPGMREWGKNLEQMRRFVRAFRDLPMNALFTGLKKDDKNESTGRTTTKPSLSGKLADEVSAFLDIVCYMYVKTVGTGEDTRDARLLLTQKTETIIAKDRTSRLPLVVEDPTMQDIFNHINGK
jgi:hypothetical protein